MASRNIYDDFKKKLDRIENHLAEEIAPQTNELFKEAIRFSLIDWYNDYTPKNYDRTYNFMNILGTAKTSGRRNVLTFSVDSGAMSNYLGWSGGSYDNTYSIPNEGKEKYHYQRLNASIGFDFMFMNGEHGHGSWMMHKSLPPYMYVEREIENGFSGRLNRIINKKIEEILRK